VVEKGVAEKTYRMGGVDTKYKTMLIPDDPMGSDLAIFSLTPSLVELYTVWNKHHGSFCGICSSSR
jgi:hypothetical protein